MQDGIIRGANRKAIRVTPTVIAGTTGDNNVMFDATEISNAVISKGGCSKLLGITIIDKDGEQVDMDLIFMKVQTNFLVFLKM